LVRWGTLALLASLAGPDSAAAQSAPPGDPHQTISVVGVEAISPLW